MTHSFPTRRSSGLRRVLFRSDRYPALVLRVDRGAPFIGDARRAERTGSGGKRLVIPADDQGDVGHEKTVPSTSSANASRLLNRIDDPLKFRHQIDPLAQLILWLARLAASLRCRSAEHTSALQSIMRTSYAVFCLIQQQT